MNTKEWQARANKVRGKLFSGLNEQEKDDAKELIIRDNPAVYGGTAAFLIKRLDEERAQQENMVQVTRDRS